jgi:hypothetical protein
VAVGDRDGVWSQPPTAVASVIRYAEEGEWTTPDGNLRGLARLYAGLVGVTATAALYGAAWLIQRPVRGPVAPGRRRPKSAEKTNPPPTQRSVWATPPPALADLVVNAIRGSWCPPAATVRLAAGRTYYALIALPVSVALYLLAGIFQRPGRLAAAALLLVIVRIFS